MQRDKPSKTNTMKEVLSVILKAIKTRAKEVNPNAPITWNELIAAIKDQIELEASDHSSDPLSRVIAKEENNLL